MPPKRILFLLHKYPYPPTDSTRFRVYWGAIEAFSGWERSFWILTWEKKDPRAEEHLRKMGALQVWNFSRWRLGGNILRRLFSWRPAQTEMLYERRIAQAFLQEAQAVDVIYVHTLRLGRYLEALDPSLRHKVLLDLNDAFSKHYLSGWRRYPLGLRGLALIEGVRFRGYERAFLRRFPHVAVVGPQDYAYLRRQLPAESLSLTQIDQCMPERPPTPAPPPQQEIGLYFLGNLYYWPNREGLGFFLRRIWPLMRAAFPQLRLQVVGRTPPAFLRRYRRVPGVVWRGFLPEAEMPAFLAQVHVFLSPVRLGAGIQGKILEALYAAKPIIAAAEATAWAEAYEPLIGLFRCAADDPPAWVEALRAILADYPAIVQAMQAPAARAHLTQHFGVAHVQSQYQTLAAYCLPPLAK
ncbi:MAG: glycosyltransferase [Bacteroidetes bacterium]|nr:MAG: glycosyltransferase [Bacteroidota bacterium]